MDRENENNLSAAEKFRKRRKEKTAKNKEKIASHNEIKQADNPDKTETIGSSNAADKMQKQEKPLPSNNSNKKMEKVPQQNTNKTEKLSDEDLELRKQEIYQEGENYTEEHVGEGQFEYRITPEREGIKTQEEASGEEEEAILEERAAINKGRVDREEYLKEQDRIKKEEDAKRREEIEKFKADGEDEEAILNEREAKEKAKTKRDEYLNKESKKKKEDDDIVELSDLEKESLDDENERKFQNPDEQGNVGINSDKAAHDAWETMEDDDKSGEEPGTKEMTDEEVEKLRREEIGGLEQASTEEMADYLNTPDPRAEIKKAQAEEEDFEEITRLDELKFQMERNYNQLIKEQKHEATEWSKLSFFEKMKNKVGLGKKEGKEDKSNPERIKWEYSTVKERVQRFKEKFGGSYEAYIQELMKNGKQADQETRDFIFCQQAIKEKQEDGTEAGKTVFEDFNKKLKDLDSVRVEAMKEYNENQEKGKFKEGFQNFYFRAMEKYSKMSTPKKALVGAVLVGGTSGLFGAGIAAGATVGGYRFAKSLGVSAAHSSIINPLMGLVSKKFRDKDFRKVEANVAKGFENQEAGNFLKQLENFNKREKKRGVARVAATGLLVGGLSYGTMKGFEYLNDVPPEIPKNESALGGRPVEEYSGKIRTSIDIDDDLGEEDWRKEAPVAEKESAGIAEKSAASSPEPPVGAYSGVDEEGLTIEDEPESDIEEVPDVVDFSLKKGDNVWDKLVSHFNGDEGKTAETINDFRKEAAQELVDKHGMSKQEAGNFIKWRFRHMDIGEEFALTKDGQLEIDNFINQEKLSQYNSGDYKKGVINSGGVDLDAAL